MRNKKPYNIPTLREIYDYIFGRQGNGQRHSLERKMQQDPFLEDAVEGFSHVKEERAKKDISILNQRIAGKKGKAPVYWYTGIAATLLLLIIAGTAYLLMENSRKWQQQTQLEKERMENLRESLAEGDTVSQSGASGPSIEVESTTKETDTTASKLTKPQPSPNVIIAESDHEPTTSEPTPTGDTTLRTTDFAIAQHDTPINTDLPYLVIIAEEQEVREKTTGAVVEVKTPTVLLPELNVEPGSRLIRGQVVDGMEHTPLPGAVVKLIGSTQSTVTDLNGYFELQVDNPEQAELLISFIGYGLLEVAVADILPEEPLTLNPELAALEEIVVTAYGTRNAEHEQNSRDYNPPRPEGGYSDLKRYLKDNAILPDTAQQEKVVVVLRFEITYNGRPANFEVVRSPSQVYSNMAIDLIRKGPKWNPATLADEFKQGSVRVRIVFRKEQ